jgi:hypothetical protein
MEEPHSHSWRFDRALAADILLALAVAAAFTLFALTAVQMEEFANSHRAFPPGRTVYM